VSLGNAMGVVYFRALLDGLHNAGRDDALVAALTDPNRPGYAQILKDGATFTWESWDAPAHGDSESHGWGATVLAVLQDDILGVRATRPGAGEIEVKVPVSPVTRASGVVSTQRGPVPITWTRTAGGQETIDLTVPVNVTAHVLVPAPDADHVLDGGRPGRFASARPQGDGLLELDIGSGHYQLSTTTSSTAARAAASTSRHRSALVLLAIAVASALGAAGVFVLLRRRRRRPA
jgi:alpha-L-rhamnosidase